MKYYTFLILLVITYLSKIGNCQVTINDSNMVEINAQTQDWYPALRVKVPTHNSCAYNLLNTNLGRDVSFFHASGYLWCRGGGYFGIDSNNMSRITTINHPAKMIKKLNGVRYQLRPISKEEQDEYDTLASGGYRYGFIPSEVELGVPEAVKNVAKDIKAISYNDIVAILVEAVKEQLVKIDSIENLLIKNSIK